MHSDSFMAECGFFRSSYDNVLNCEEPIKFGSKKEKLTFIKQHCYNLETAKQCPVYKRLMAEKYKDVG